MPAFVWISLAILLAGLVGGIVWTAINARRLWKRGRPALRRMTTESGSLSDRAAALERRLATLEPKTAQLQRDTRGLARALSRARLQLGVLREAKRMLTFPFAFMPRK